MPTPKPKKMIDAALDYLNRGWKLIDVPFESKNPNRRGWQKERLSPHELEERFSHGPKNISVLWGEPSGHLIDVDLDSPEAVKLSRHVLPATDAVFGRTSSPTSHHLYVVSSPIDTKKFEDPSNNKNKGERGTLVEIRSTGHHTIVPPSVHPSGEPIEWADDGDPAEVSPNDLIASVKALAAASLLARRWTKGIRHSMALSLAGGLLRSEWEIQKVEEFVTNVATAAGDTEIADRVKAVQTTFEKMQSGDETTGWPRLAELIDETTVKRICEWLDIQPLSEPAPSAAKQEFSRTEVGNAERLIARHGQDLRYWRSKDKWLIWNGRRWKIDDDGAITRKAVETVKAMYTEAPDIPSEHDRKKFINHVTRSESKRQLKAMIELAQSLEGITVKDEELDQHPFLLNVLNGTIDLKSGELLPHRRKDLMTKIIPIAFDPNATSLRFIDFLRDVTEFNLELMKFIQRAIGYSLTGVTSERAVFVLHGTGANGKSILLKTVEMLLGDYAARTPTETLMRRGNRGARNDLARLLGCRFTYSSEGDVGDAFSEALIKELTGGDRIAVRHLYKEYFEFQPEFKIWLATNHKPSISGTDDAIWDRIKLVPFTVTIPPQDRIPEPELMNRFRDELPGILNFAVKGCLAWQKSGLGTPAVVTRATNAYRNEMDTLSAFLDECCVEAEAARVGSQDLHNHYRQWCIDCGEESLSANKFAARLSERGFKKKKSNRMTWFGLGLRADDDLGESPREGRYGSHLDNLREEASVIDIDTHRRPKPSHSA